ncbi:MAG: hypothetical protein AB8B66_02360 [Rickettsiaceae bacterium]
MNMVQAAEIAFTDLTNEDKVQANESQVEFSKVQDVIIDLSGEHVLPPE